jgi:hypothetical protein
MPALQRRVASSQEIRSISSWISKKQRWTFSRKDFLHKKETTIMKRNCYLKGIFSNVNSTAFGLTSVVIWALSFARPLPSFVRQTLIQFVFRQSRLMAAIASK